MSKKQKPEDLTFLFALLQLLENYSEELEAVDVLFKGTLKNRSKLFIEEIDKVLTPIYRPATVTEINQFMDLYNELADSVDKVKQLYLEECKKEQ